MPWDAAQAMTNMIFEDQRLHGPYAEVLYGLENAEALRLHVMAARSSRFPYNRDTIMKVIVDQADPNDDDARAVLRDAIERLDWDHPFRDEAIRAHGGFMHATNNRRGTTPSQSRSRPRAGR
ncbi:hypothetical protein [Micromonospora sp. NBC_00858]|uniref:hypothetical protein n=1 Tax=Micromonospora sp. NBC_00858 TaxID=2975979 RepID=UPI00386EC02D|nr:hypothetical protein OG990_04890 [Micromonospora sp. NBC_00858]